MKFYKDQDGVERGVVVVRHSVTRKEYDQMRDWATFKSKSDYDAPYHKVTLMLSHFLSEYLCIFDPEDQGYAPEPETSTQEWQLGQA